jgi:transglutaminase-like putative cysteine protease
MWGGLPEYLAYAQEAPQKVSYEEAVKQLDDFFRPFEELQAELDKTAFDVEAKAKALGRDMPAIFEFVRDQVRYESYVGVLRGARGTLIGLAGNSIDQSLLLAELLRHNGFQVQFVRGTLDEATAKRLIEEMLQTPIQPVSEVKADPAQASSEMGDVGLSPAEYKKVVAA